MGYQCVLHVVGTHPAPVGGRGEGGVEAVEVEHQWAVVALHEGRHSAAPERPSIATKGLKRDSRVKFLCHMSARYGSR